MEKRKVQCVIFYCDAEGLKHFLLLRVNKKRGLFWQNCTGSVEDGETFKMGALREAIEETNLSKENIKSITETNMQFTFVDQWEHYVTEKVFFIQCEGFWDVVLDETEHCEFKWQVESYLDPTLLKYDSNRDALIKCLEI
jgi:8-oxo-dGTP pyrophosphatase MutT (NUDIX family)